MVLFVILAGYLIIYNIFNISVKTDIRAYGLLKNVGTTGKQLKKIVRMQAWKLSAVGIPIGLIFGYLAGFCMSPALTADAQISAQAGQTTQTVERWMNSCHNSTSSAKYYASYCWEWKSQKRPTEIDIKIPEINPVFQKQWNPMYDQYDW